MIPFTSAGQLLLQIDGLCNRLGFPQPSVVSRSFRSQKRAGTEKEREAALKMMDPENVNEKRGEEATFVLHIKYRQNATWQGTVTWAEKNQSCEFRSALELLKLVDSALDREYEKQDGTDEQMVETA